MPWGLASMGPDPLISVSQYGNIGMNIGMGHIHHQTSIF